MKCWDDIAHKKIKLTSEMDEITQLVTRWRRMELKSWAAILDSFEYDQRRNVAPKWWFFVHDAVAERLAASGAAGDDGGGDAKLTESLQHFVEASSLLEFEEKLKLIEVRWFYVWSGLLFGIQNLVLKGQSCAFCNTYQKL